MSSAICFNLDQSKILLSGNGLIATFQLLSAASLNLGQFQNGVFRNGFIIHLLWYIRDNLQTNTLHADGFGVGLFWCH